MENKIKVLNLYCGIGGNRKLWPNDKIEVIAIEIDPEIAKIYSDFFPMDKIVICDAHQYLLEHYKEFDFIWSSPPCITHSKTNLFLRGQGKIRYPDLRLYEEIIFLKSLSESKNKKLKFVVENVKPYYEPLIKGQECGRHLFWSNFNIVNIANNEVQIGTFNRKTTKLAQIKANQKYINPNRDWLGFNLKDIKINNYKKRQLLRNCVNPDIGLHIFKMAFFDSQKNLELTKKDDN